MGAMREEFEIQYVMHVCGVDRARAVKKIEMMDGEGLLSRHSEAYGYKYCLQATDDAWWGRQAALDAKEQNHG